jgi:hypothetical protein
MAAYGASASLPDAPAKVPDIGLVIDNQDADAHA